MSLILASSKLTENKSEIASEKPSSFTNFFRSPIEIEPDSEIAVQSVKINRSGHVVANDAFFCHYFGGPRGPDADGDDLLAGQDIYVSRTIKLEDGTYTIDAFTREIDRALDAQYDHPAIFGQATVTLNLDTEGNEQGVAIKFVQRASGSGTSSIPQLTDVAAFQLGTTPGLTGPSSDFTWVSGTGIFARTGSDATSIDDASCIGVLKDKPFSSTTGKCTFDSMTNASLGGHWCVGLSRAQIEAEGTSSSATQIVQGPYSDGSPSKYYDLDNELVPGVFNMSDYCVMCDDTNIIVLQSSWDPLAGGYPGRPVMKELTYFGLGGSVAAKLTKTQFYASYDGVRFGARGDEITLDFKQKGKTVFDPVLDSTNDDLNDEIYEVFSPIGTTRYALYPIINLGKGSVRLLTYESDLTDLSYKYPSYSIGSKTYVPGSDMFSTESSRTLINEGVRVSDVVKRSLASGNGDENAIKYVDYQQIYWYRQVSPFVPPKALVPFERLQFLGPNASGGVKFSHILTIDKIDEDDFENSLLVRQHWPNMSYKLGYGEKALLEDYSGESYVSGSGTNTITFTSTEEMKKSNITSFIRCPTLTHKSFNGAQQSLSKILYQVPQFSNDGTEFGPLYFEANEKTYVSLNNPTSMILNSLQVQFVSYDEKEIDSLDGVSQVMFHVRRKK